MPLGRSRTLIRRATFDLTGLPPTPEEIDAFLDGRVAGRVRARSSIACSPRRPTASAGAGTGSTWCATPTPPATTPTTRFRRCTAIATGSSTRSTATCPTTSSCASNSPAICCPAADDAGAPATKLIATGYLANARRFGSYEDARYPWHLTIEDTIDNLGRTFLGLTINCARCHDHKFDPITTEDYYALYGFFSEHALSLARHRAGQGAARSGAAGRREREIERAENAESTRANVKRRRSADKTRRRAGSPEQSAKDGRSALTT